MSITVKVLLHKQKKLQDGRSPLILRFTGSRKHKYITLSIRLLPKEWDEAKGRVNSKHPQQRVMNESIAITLAKCEAIAARMEADGHTALEEVVEAFKGDDRPDAVSLFDFFERIIERCNNNEMRGSARAYGDTLAKLKKFRKDLDFRHLNVTFLEDWNSDLLRTHRIGGIGVRMRSLRAVINKAIREDVWEGPNPFAKFKIKRQETEKRALSIEDLRKIKAIDFDTHSPNGNTAKSETSMEQARNIYMFLLYSSGMNLIDAARLRWEDVQGDEIKYRRRKTGKLMRMPLTEQLKELVRWFRSNPRVKKSPYVLPVLRDGVKDEYDYYRWQSKRINERLKVIGKRCGIETKLTTYTARHSWATLAKHNAVPIEMISEILGHSDIRTTQIYLAGFANDKKSETLNRLSNLL